MLLSVLILTLFFINVKASSSVKICTFGGNVMTCIIESGNDHFNVTADVNKDELRQVTTLTLKVGTPDASYEPPKDSSGIVYPDWTLMPGIRDIEIQFHLKDVTEEFRLSLDDFHYLPTDSFKGIKELVRFNLTSDSPEVRFDIGLLSDSHQLNLIWVEGCMISTGSGETWNNLKNVSDLKLLGKQIGNLDLDWLPLDTLVSILLSLNKIEGINGSTAQKMNRLRFLSMAVTQVQSLDWSFIKVLAPQLHMLALEGYNLGNISENTIPQNSTIQDLTLTRSANTELIDSYSFTGNHYKSIELGGMESLSRIGNNVASSCYNLVNLKITNMKILRSMPTSLGEEVRPENIQLTNSPMLLEVPATLFQVGVYFNSKLTEVNVLGTELDATCPCHASYLAAMSVVGKIEIQANCLQNWIKEGKCQQGENCWSFNKVCNETCSSTSDPFSYDCNCKEDEILLPDQYSCVSRTGCKEEGEYTLHCTDYNVTCYQEYDVFECRCENLEMWDSNKKSCVTNNQIPIVSPSQTTKTPMTLIPANTTKTPMTLIPANTTKTPMTLIPANTTKTPMTLIPANTTKTPMTLIPANTTKTPMTLIPANTTTKTVPTKSLKTQTQIVPIKTLQTPTHITHTVTAKTIRTLTHTNTTHNVTNTTQTPNHPTTNAATSSLPSWEITIIIVPIVILIILCILLLVLLYCYKKKKLPAARVFQRKKSPGLLDSGECIEIDVA